MKPVIYSLLGLLLVASLSCRKTYEALVPYDFTNLPGSGQFGTAVRAVTNGVYTVSNGASEFGDQVALKWTYLHNGADTSYYLSVFTGKDAAYFNLEGTSQTDSLVLGGYWRKLVNDQIGLAQLTLRVKHQGKLQLYKGQLAPGDTMVIDGLYGDKNSKLSHPITLTYNRPLNSRPFSIMAHRSGGRTSDLLPASENSVEIIKLASRLGATGIEVDVRYTKDGVPILYHDNTLNLRLIQKNGLMGPVEDYTYQQLSTFVRLINGEKIPTLEEALETVVNNTALNFVWLDTKYIGPMDKVQAIQQKYRQKALQAGRDLRIIIGLPSTEAVDSYKALANKENTPILCELDTALTRSLGARIWAPRWTLGPQTAEVQAMKAAGLTVFVWTLDEPEFIREFIGQNQFDGILSNYSPVVAFYHYTEQP
ncbi:MULTISPECIES: glycerophosphodiester phosphodiesterase family protein [unclassified Spirosoma]|uniref:glycerophosphodiester phosphodiesterase n=1 Tax=unclassified Spirosoma TaxID=2621999 RepID=UPI00095FA0F4|nr:MULTISPECIES: glycerophosphodiester phosphodiesterase family protein [unclassified Spirosoma]MBN8825864.1 glycerophosphodiester phosphodiesterase family protein [Spirosoma sp.]OJW70558.1 MAG: glycerophosphodiester phosphodiesterase [Spirosoma sp. 48-14]